jgi:hypothetical protein
VRALVVLFFGVLTLGALLLFRRKAVDVEQLQALDGPGDIDPTNADSTEDLETERDAAETVSAVEAPETLEQPTLSASGVVAGFGYSVCRAILWDCDVWNIRSFWRRRVLFEAGQSFTFRVVTRGGGGSDSYSVGVGSAIGIVCYRIKYGLLTDPSPDLG